MSKVSSSSQSKIPSQLPSKSAWARGPPQSTSSASSPRTQSPAPTSATPPATATHSRRPSALTGQGVSIKDGVSVPRSNAGHVKQASSVTFGSIDDASSAPISSSPASIPAIKAETVKSFGTVPASPSPTSVNGKQPVGSVRGANGSSNGTSTSSTSEAKKPFSKFDVKQLFQNPSSSSPTPSVSSPLPSSSPSVRPSALPPQHTPPASQLGNGPYTPFTPSAQFRTPTTPANGPAGPGQPPRSPVSFRPMANGAGGAGARPSTGPTPPAGPPQGMPAAMPSPRMTPHPHPATPAGLPPGTPVGWQPYAYSYYVPGLPAEHYMQPHSPYGQWMPPQGFQPPPQHPQAHMPHVPPGPPGPPHSGMPMSPRNPPPPLQGPGTPTPSHAVPAQHQHVPSSTASTISSPPSTPSTLGPAGPTGNARLNSGASAFVPRQSKIVIKSIDGQEVDLRALGKTPSQSGAPVAPPSPAPSPARRSTIRMETEEAKNKRLAEEKEKERKKEEEEERKRKEIEEKERKERQEVEKKKREEEERVQREQDERKRKEEEEVRRKEEEDKERMRKEEEEKERVRKEEEEKVRVEEERKKKEEEEKQVKREEEQKKRKEEEEQRMREEEEKRKEEEEAEAAKAKAETPAPPPEEKPAEPEMEEGEVKEEAPAAAEEEKKDEEQKPKDKGPLRIDTAIPSPEQKRRPGPLDLSSTRQTNISQPLPSALATARIIDDLGSVTYPQGIQSPRPELNANAKNGKFRYDRDFLLQFMSICKEKPDHLPPLDAIGIEPASDHYMSRGGSQRGSRSAAMSTPPALSRQASVGLGISSFGKPGGFAMGQFATPTSKLSSEERFAMASGARPGPSGPGASAFGGRPPAMSRTPSQGGPGASGSGRTRSHRGNKRPGDKNGGPGQMSFQHQPPGGLMGPPLEPVAPLQASANRWVPQSSARKPVNDDSPEVVDRKVRGLLNKLTMERFESISDQIIGWANKSEKEKDGRTLIQVIRLVFEKATDEAAWSEMYARLCRKMMEQISPDVQDEGIRNAEGKPITGGQLFRKYLLNRCQEDFERGWAAKESTAAAAKGKASADAALAAANEGKEEEEAELYSEEYYAAAKAKRQGLGLVKFIGELFKLQMLTERIMHECIKKLLSNVDNPEEEEIESLCQLLTTIGQILDTPRAKQYMDIYFARMKELAKNQKVSSRMQFMLQDVIELRHRNWIPRNAMAAPKTIAEIHQQAAKEQAMNERESAQRMNTMSRGGSRRGQDRQDQQQGDGWTAARPAKAGDLSNFGKISKQSPMTFGPSGIFASKKEIKESKRDSTISRSTSGNMFAMLNNAEAAEAAAKPSRPPSRKPSVDLSQAGTPSEPSQRRKIQLLPRSKPLEDEESKPETPSASRAGSDDGEEADGEPTMSEEEAKRRIAEDSKEFFAIRDLDEAEEYFTKLPQGHRFRLVDSLLTKAIESKVTDAELVAGLFRRAAEKDLCSPAAFEEGFMGTAEFIDDIAVDAPKAPELFAIMMKGAGLDKDQERRDRIVDKSMDKDKLISMLSS